MQVSVEESGVIERKLTISIPAQEISRQIDERLKKVARQASIPGFRPGKAPGNVIRQRYSAQVTDEVIGDTINRSYRAALEQEKIIPAGLVSVEPQPFDANTDFRYVATIELFPEMPAITLAGTEIEQPVCRVVARDIDDTLETIRRRHPHHAKKHAASALGDRVTMDFDGTIDDQPFNGSQARDFAFILGEGQMLEPFDTALCGVNAGDNKQVTLAFPDDYQGAEVAGKTARFDVTVKKVETVELLPDGALATRLGIADGSVTRMREEIEASMQRELSARLRTTQRDRVLQALQQAYDLPTPKALVEEEIDRAIAALNRQLSAQGLPHRELPRDTYRAAAQQRVATGLLIRGVIEQQQLKAEPSAVKTRIDELATGYDDADAFVKSCYSTPEQLQQVESMVLEDQLVEAMLKTANVTETALSFKEFMRPDEAD